jgi:hypothetical protein
MKIRYQTWRRFTRVAGPLASIAFLVLFFRPAHWLEISIIIFCFSIAGSGVLVAILMRTGFIQFTYSDTDKKSMGYKMSQTVAKMEQIQKRGFSDSYYDGLGVEPPKQKEPDDKPAA